jgi:hypothetical protein
MNYIFSKSKANIEAVAPVFCFNFAKPTIQLQETPDGALNYYSATTR